MKQKRNKSGMRGIVGRRVTVIREVPSVRYSLTSEPAPAKTFATIRRVTASGRYWLDRLVLCAEVLKPPRITKAMVARLGEPEHHRYLERLAYPTLLVRKRRTFSRSELRFVRRDYRGVGRALSPRQAEAVRLKPEGHAKGCRCLHCHIATHPSQPQAEAKFPAPPPCTKIAHRAYCPSRNGLPCDQLPQPPEEGR